KAEERIGKSVVQAQVEATATGDAGLATYRMVDGRPARIAFQRLAEAPWVLNFAVPLADLPSSTPLFAFIGIAVLLGVVSVGIAIGVGRQIARPISGLAQRAPAIVEGEATAVESTSVIREVQHLQGALIDGAAKVRAANQEREATAAELRRANERLEARVAERTAQLTQANADLQAALARQEAVTAELEQANIETEQANSDFQEANLQLEEANSELEQEVEERRRVEEALAAQQHLLQTILESAAEGIIVCDARGSLTFVNAQARAWARVPPEGRSLLEAETIWGPSLDAGGRVIPVSEWPINHALHGERVTGFEMNRVTPGGEPLTLLVSTAALIGEKGAVSGAVAVWSDITRRKQAEAQLAQQAGELRQQAQILDLGHVLIRDADSRILAWSAGMEALYGWTPAEAIGQVVPQLFHTVFPTASVETVQAALETDGHWEGELVRTAKDQSRITVASHQVVYRDPAGGPVRVLEVDTDITALKLVEAALHQALADRDALLREVHHRVKNNLQMLCDLMYLQMEAMPDRDQHQDLQDAYSRIYAIARLHEQLHQAMHSGQIQLPEYLRRLVTGFTNLYPDVPVLVEAASTDVRLDLDRAIHVGLIVNELLTNAIKHAFAAGQPGAVVVAVSADREQISLQVQDNGRGLPADFDLEHATSLGLRTVYLLARRLEAQVTVTGNGGTTFTLTFPARADAPVEPK
ncbi:MAG TPA: PAS domain S-box protein, partial [Candidatus Sulfotelmatobacter sp.]|nr:PAS domain S-box protein [Candidatus Sulfotelmatobacter sp.]